jgi:hypothetical protein
MLLKVKYQFYDNTKGLGHEKLYRLGEIVEVDKATLDAFPEYFESPGAKEAKDVPDKMVRKTKTKGVK